MDDSKPVPIDSAAWVPPAAPPDAPLASPSPAAPAPQQDQWGLAMKKRGPVAAWLGLPLITFGIYHLVWYYKIHNELRQYDQRQSRLNPLGSMLVLLLLGWTIVAPLISYYNTGEAIAKAQRAAGIPVTCSPIASMLLYFVFGLNTWYMQKQLNLVVEAYPGATRGVEVPLPASGRAVLTV
jgi:hypothetical protein